MSGSPARILRWYPPEWRARYGDELVALMEDTYGEGMPVPWRGRVGIVRAGLYERLRRVRPDGTSPSRALRSGSLLVLSGWAVMVLGGFAYAKLSEHWDEATPYDLRHLPAIGYNATVGAAAIGTLLVGVGAALTLPALVALLRSGGWRQIRRPVVGAAAAVAVTVGYSVAVVALGTGPRALAGPTRAVGMTWAALVSLSVAALTAAAVVVARRLSLSRRLLEVEGLLALLLTAVMVVVTAGTALWWAATARDTAILSGSRSGLFATSGALSMSAAAALMMAGVVVAMTGAVRVVRSLRAASSPAAD